MLAPTHPPIVTLAHPLSPSSTPGKRALGQTSYRVELLNDAEAQYMFEEGRVRRVPPSTADPELPVRATDVKYGMKIRALYPDTGKYFVCTVDGLSARDANGSTAMIVFPMLVTAIEVPIEYLRFTDSDAKKKKEEEERKVRDEGRGLRAEG